MQTEDVRRWNKPGLMKMPGDSGVNSTTEKLFKICSVAEQVSDYQHNVLPHIIHALMIQSLTQCLNLTRFNSHHMAMQAEMETVGKLDRTYTDPGEVLEATFFRSDLNCDGLTEPQNCTLLSGGTGWYLFIF